MKRTIAAVGMGLLLSVIPIAGLMYLAITYDNAVEFTQVNGTATIEPGINAGYVLDLRFEVRGHNRCENQTQHWLTRPQEWLDAKGLKEPVRRTIAVTVNGLAPLEGRVPYHVRFDLPLNIEPGPWLYEARAAYTCEWLPGVMRTKMIQYPPVPVAVP